MWYFAATSDIELQYTHISGVDNKVADALSRWQGTADQWQLLGLHVVHPVWLQVSHDFWNYIQNCNFSYKLFIICCICVLVRALAQAWPDILY